MKKCEKMKKVFRERIIQLGAEANASEFARNCGLKQQDISRYLNHGALPVSDKLAQISTSFNVTTDWLLGLSDTTPAITATNSAVAIHNSTAHNGCGAADTKSAEIISSQQQTIFRLTGIIESLTQKGTQI